MPRNSNGEFYLSPGTAAVADEVAYSAHVNQRFEDLRADANTPRPVLFGGTGASSAANARANLGVRAATDTPSLANGNTFAGVNVFSQAVDAAGPTATKMRLMGTAASAIDAHNVAGDRIGRLLFDNSAHTVTLRLDASGSQPEAWIALNRDGTFRVNGSPVYHTGNKPAAADVSGLSPLATATVAPVANGGTGAATAAAARTNLGVPPATRSVVAGTGLTGGGDMTQDRTVHADIATQAEAQAGTANLKLMTPLRTQQAVAAWSLGIGQSWVAGGSGISRATNTTYQNTTGAPIMVCVSLATNGNGSLLCGADAGAMVTIYSSNDWDRDSFNFIVPPGHYYRLNSSDTIHFWSELR